MVYGCNDKNKNLNKLLNVLGELLILIGFNGWRLSVRFIIRFCQFLQSVHGRFIHPTKRFIHRFYLGGCFLFLSFVNKNKKNTSRALDLNNHLGQ